MRTALHPQRHTVEHRASVYHNNTTQSVYPAFPTSLHHANPSASGDGHSSYEPSEYRHSDAQYHHVDRDGLDLQSSPGQHYGLMNGNPTSKLSSASTQHDVAPPLPHEHNNTASLGQFDMLPPSSSTHASWQALHDYAQSHAAEHGYALSINTTAKNRSRIKLACVCYGQPKNTHKLTAETRIRKNRVSYKTGCRMWIEGKKQEDGTWLLRVGEPQHNHPGRPSEGWAVQRKRTWGVFGGRIGVGGVTAKEELARLSSTGKTRSEDADEDEENEDEQQEVASNHNLERGGLVWKIVEQEMLRKGEPSPGRDRGVGRTVEVLQARLPDIHILKRDVYNIRAQIKRARKAVGQQVGDGVNSDEEEAQAEAGADEDVAEEEEEEEEEGDDDDDDEEHETKDTSAKPSSLSQQNNHRQHSLSTTHIRDFAQIDLSLITHSPNTPQLRMPITPSQALLASSAEVEHLRYEVAQLKNLLGEKTKEIKEKTIEIAGLRAQNEYLRSITDMTSMGMHA